MNLYTWLKIIKGYLSEVNINIESYFSNHRLLCQDIKLPGPCKTFYVRNLRVFKNATVIVPGKFFQQSLKFVVKA